MGFYIPEDSIERLRAYKYSSIDKSLTSKYILQPWWTWLVTLFPLYVAPNTITLLGLGCVGVNFLSLLWYNPTLACGPKPLLVSQGGAWDPLFRPSVPAAEGWVSWFGFVAREEPPACAPQWLFFTFAIGLFVYQSLDAIDGKQARRTGTSGPLGELFDHGCDALNTTLEVVLTASALNLGLSWWLVASLVATNANFYLTTWEEFHTGTLYLSAFSGPVEGILLIVIVFTVTGFTGPTFWDQGLLTVFGFSPSFIASLPIRNIPINDFFLTASTLALFANVFSSAHNVFLSLPPHSRTRSALLKPLSRLIPYLVHTLAMITWLSSNDFIMSTTLLIPFFIFWGLSFAHHVGLLILAHLTQSGFPSLSHHPLLILSVLGSLDANLANVGYGFQGSSGSAAVVVAGSLVAAVGVYGHFIWEVIGDICRFYDMNCLTIKYRKDEGKRPVGSKEH